jgi:hypothetical protein
MMLRTRLAACWRRVGGWGKGRSIVREHPPTLYARAQGEALLAASGGAADRQTLHEGLELLRKVSERRGQQLAARSTGNGGGRGVLGSGRTSFVAAAAPRSASAGVAVPGRNGGAQSGGGRGGRTKGRASR